MEKNNTEKEQERGRKAMHLEEWQCVCGSSRKGPAQFGFLHRQWSPVYITITAKGTSTLLRAR